MALREVFYIFLLCTTISCIDSKSCQAKIKEYSHSISTFMGMLNIFWISGLTKLSKIYLQIMSPDMLSHSHFATRATNITDWLKWTIARSWNPLIQLCANHVGNFTWTLIKWTCCQSPRKLSTAFGRMHSVSIAMRKWTILISRWSSQIPQQNFMAIIIKTILTASRTLETEILVPMWHFVIIADGTTRSWTVSMIDCLRRKLDMFALTSLIWWVLIYIVSHFIPYHDY